MDKTIFVQIASYRDDELPKTIKDCLSKAKNPDRIHFGICHQFDEDTEHDLDKYKDDARFRIKNIPWRESRGAGLARSICQGLYENQNFSLQIDSHMRFVQNWDELMIGEWEACEEEKAVLSCYPTEFNYKNGKEIYSEFVPTMLVVDNFYDGFIPTFFGKLLGGKRQKPYKVAFASGGFMFCHGEVCKEVLQYPEISFPEEMAYCLRLFTYGYRIFCPSQILLYHLYNRTQLGGHYYWNDFNEDPELVRQGVYQKMQDDSNAFQRRLLLEGDSTLLGPDATLEEFENYNGINLKERLVHPDHRKALEPPYATDGEWVKEMLKLKPIDVKIEINTGDFEKHDDYDFWYFTLCDELNIELVRDDIYLDDWSQETITIDKRYELRSVPGKYVVWPHSTSRGWLERKEYPYPQA